MQNNNNTDEKNFQDLLDKSQSKRSDILRAAALAHGSGMKETQIARMQTCGYYLTFLHDRDMTKSCLETGFFCGNRMCPACAWRKSVEDAVKIACILQAAVNKKYKLLFATLTAANVEAHELTAAVKKYSTAYTDLMRQGRYKNIAGALRKIEITYNDKTCLYHPHVHSVWIVSQSWRPPTHKNLAADWAHQLDYEYRVSANAQDIRTVRSATHADILEFAKYPAKSADILKNEDTFKTFYRAMHGTRLITYLRLARKLATMYKNGELDVYKKTDLTEYVYRSAWKWNAAGYELDRLYELDEPVRLGKKNTDETAGDND